MEQRTLIITSHWFDLERRPFAAHGVWGRPIGWQVASVFSSSDSSPGALEPLIEGSGGAPGVIYRVWLVHFPVGTAVADGTLEEELHRVNAWSESVSESHLLVFLHTAAEEERWLRGPWTQGSYPKFQNSAVSVIATQEDLYDLFDSKVLIGFFRGNEWAGFLDALAKIWDSFYEFGWLRDLLLTLAPFHLAVQAWWGVSALRRATSDFEYELVRFGRGAGEPLIDRINEKRSELREVSCHQGSSEPGQLDDLFPRLSQLCSSRDLGSISLGSGTRRKVNRALVIASPPSDAPFLTIQQANAERHVGIDEYEFSLAKVSEVLANPNPDAILGCFDEALVVIAGNERLADLLLSHWREEQTGSNQL